MPGNSFFRFKRFSLNQDRCAMKIGTDGALMGAWCTVENATQVLDIGTGTGLIALMVAQRINGAEFHITAVEADREASIQAKENIEHAEWSKHIEVVHTMLQDYDTQTKFDLIVTNPPFFTNSLTAPDGKRTMARHTLSLSAHDICNFAARHLTCNGLLSLILPTKEAADFEQTARETGLYLARATSVSFKTQAAPKRIMAEYTLQPKETILRDTLSVSNENGQYTSDFIHLLQPFYLHF